MLKTIYLNLDDDINKIVAQLSKTAADEVVLVFPKRSQLFSDSINLRLLKKQIDMLGKKASILTMDELGQAYAKEAGFGLKFLPRKNIGRSFSDIKPPQGRVKAKGRTVKRVARPKPEAVTITEIEEAPSLPTKLSPAKDYSVLEPEAALESQIDQDLPGLEVHENVFNLPRVSSKQETKARKPKTRKRAWLVVFVAAALVIALVLVLFVLPSAAITVHAKRQVVSRDVELSAATTITEPDSQKLALPATLVQKSFDIRQNFTTVGKREVGAKSVGSVYIYNLTGKPLNLKASTTTLNVGNKSYVLTVDQQGIKTASGANADDATLPFADIVATGGGEEFNLPAGTRMEITNQVFGAQPQVLYAKTKTQITGGTSRFISVIGDEDVTKAQEGLKAKAVTDIQNELKSQNLTLFDGAFSPIELTNFSTDKAVGTESPNFVASGSLKFAGLAVNSNQLSELIRDRITSTFQAGKRLQDQSKDTMTVKVRSADPNTGVLGLSVHYESAAQFDFDIADIKPKLTGKTKEEASELLLSRAEIERVDITLSPAWQNTVPRFTGKIRVDIQE